MKAIELKMPDKVLEKLSNLAAREHQPVDAFALRKLEELIRAAEGVTELERRVLRGDRALGTGGTANSNSATIGSTTRTERHARAEGGT